MWWVRALSALEQSRFGSVMSPVAVSVVGVRVCVLGYDEVDVVLVRHRQQCDSECVQQTFSAEHICW